MPSYNTPLYQAERLEWVVLRCDLLLEETSQRSPHHDVVTHLGDLGEKEQGEETSDAAKTAREDTAELCKHGS